MLNVVKRNFGLSLLLLALFCLFLGIALFSEGTYDPGDGIRHYLVARYAFAHPELYLYSWGKPFFTFLSSPFCQLGLIGANFFNILCGILTGVLCVSVAKRSGSSHPLTVIIFLFFIPSYFATMNSGLTEPLFGLVLAAGLYFTFSRQYIITALLLSFLPYVRSEGYLILPLFGLLFLYRRKILPAAALATGTLVYSLIGYFYYHDFFWLIAENPYTGSNADLYKSGELLHFVKQYDFIFGVPVLIIFLVGVYRVFSSPAKISSDEPGSFRLEYLLLILGSAVVYFGAHSVFWWKGLCGSLGLERVMAGIAPVIALTALKGYDLLLDKLGDWKRIKLVLSAAFLSYVVIFPFTRKFFPFKLEGEQKLIAKTGEWFRNSDYKDQKVFFLHPYLFHTLDLDPYDKKKADELWSLYPLIKTWGIKSIPDKTIIMWDGHYGPNECRIPLDTIIQDTNFRLLRIFRNEDNLIVLGGHRFDVYVFIKDPIPVTRLAADTFDLESNTGIENANTISEEAARSGRRASKLSGENEFSVLIKKQTLELAENERIMKIELSAQLMAPEGVKEPLLVMSVDDASGKQVVWDGRPVKDIPADSLWHRSSSLFYLDPEMMKTAHTLKFYLWNPHKSAFFMDDVELTYYGLSRNP